MTRTTVLWTKDKTPHWGDEALARGLSHWGPNMTPLEAKFIFRGLIFTTLAVPVDPSQKSEDGPVLRVAQAPEGGWGVPVFTHPDMLKDFSKSAGWATAGVEVPWTAVAARQAFHTLSQVAGVECWVNPGSSTLKLDQTALRILAQGQIPDPRTLGAGRPDAKPLEITVVNNLNQIRSATGKASERTLGVLRATLAQYPNVTWATVFRVGDGPAVLGLYLTSPLSSSALETIDRLLARSDFPASVITISTELEASLAKAAPPFYRRGS